MIPKVSYYLYIQLSYITEGLFNEKKKYYVEIRVSARIELTWICIVSPSGRYGPMSIHVSLGNWNDKIKKKFDAYRENILLFNRYFRYCHRILFIFYKSMDIWFDWKKKWINQFILLFWLMKTINILVLLFFFFVHITL